MSDKELTKEEKIEKAKELMSELRNLELSKEELEGVFAGAVDVADSPAMAMGTLYVPD